MSVIQLSGKRREVLGKGGARQARAAGQIPGVIYGHGEQPLAVAVDGRLGGIGALTPEQWGLVGVTGAPLLGYVTTWYAALQRAPAALVSSVLVGGAVLTAGLAVMRTGTVPAPAVETGLALLAIGVVMAMAAWRRPVPVVAGRVESVGGPR